VCAWRVVLCSTYVLIHQKVRNTITTREYVSRYVPACVWQCTTHSQSSGGNRNSKRLALLASSAIWLHIPLLWETLHPRLATIFHLTEGKKASTETSWHWTREGFICKLETVPRTMDWNDTLNYDSYLQIESSWTSCKPSLTSQQRFCPLKNCSYPPEEQSPIRLVLRSHLVYAWP